MRPALVPLSPRGERGGGWGEAQRLQTLGFGPLTPTPFPQRGEGRRRRENQAVSDLQLPLIIFFAEVCVVTISTLRIIAIARGQTLVAPVLGFFEVTTWLFAIGQVM